MKVVGVLALQGAVREHLAMLQTLPNVEARAVKTREEIEAVDGLILPGGESTAMGKIMKYFSLTDFIRDKIQAGLPVWGTCAGLILLAKEIVEQETTYFATMDVVVKRNAYGSQLDSFVTKCVIPQVAEHELPLVFIRAPYIVKAGEEVQVLASYQDKIIAAQQGKMLATAFHPELTEDNAFHKYFVSLID